MQTIQLADPAVGNLMTISTDNWTDINQMVGFVLAVRHGWDDINRRMPAFAPLESASGLWRSTTFPAIGRQPAALTGYAALATAGLKDLQHKLGSLKPGDDLPAALKTQAEMYFAALNLGTKALAASNEMRALASEQAASKTSTHHNSPHWHTQPSREHNRSSYSSIYNI